MTRHLTLIFALLLLIVAFIGANVVVSRATPGVKLDITQGKQFTLTRGSRNIAKSPVEPINLKLYYSQRLAQGMPPIQSYAQRVRELLDSYVASSDGKIKLEVIDPEPDSDAEDAAVESGLRGIPIGNDSLYLGLVGTNSIDTREVIPIFDPSKERFLEYDVAKLITNLGTPKKSVVGYISPLQLEGGYITNFRTKQPEPTRQWQVLDEVKQLYTVRKLDPEKIVEIPSDIDVLMVVHPKNLNPGVLLAIDQYVLRGGRLMLFVDPLCEADSDGTPWQENAARASQLDRILDAWGVVVPPGLLAGDQDLALRVIDNQRGGQEQVPYVVWMGLKGENLNKNDTVTGQAQVVNVATSGYVKEKDGAAAPHATIEPLLMTTDKASVVNVDQLGTDWNPKKLYAEFVPGKEKMTLAARLSGTVKTAFPDGPPANADGKPMIDPASMLKESNGSINVLLFADVDIMSDRMWIQTQNWGGMRLVNKLASNGDMILAAVDNFSGSNDLMQIRARQESARPFTKVDEIRKLAEQQYQREEVRLTKELEDTQRRIAELEGQRGDDKSAGVVLTPQQQEEIKKFRTKSLETRKKLRDVKFNLRKDIEDLGTKLKWINIAAMPLGVIGAAIVIWLIRRARS